MKVQFFNGGLANQAFQYIFARYNELSYPGDVVYLDDSYFALNTVHNGYELEKVFGIKPHFLSECFDEDVWNYILEEKSKGKSVPQILNENGIEMYMVSEVEDAFHGFNPFYGKVVKVPCEKYDHNIIGASGDVYYHGYWINKWWMEKYKDIFLKEFTFPKIEDEKNKVYEEKIENTHSVSIHIRRGDYVTLKCDYKDFQYGILISRFKEKILISTEVETDVKKWNLFVFSDDIEWCKDHQKEMGMDSFGEVIFVEENISGKNYIDMQLMSRCEAMIMSNSAFCYLAALLNTRKKIVINPTSREV